MDEADYLGDRIAIMGEGTIRTEGSSMFLKKTFGVGYTLNIFKKDKTNKDNSEVISIVEGIIPSAHYEPNVSTELSFKLPLETSD
jgi:ABC-type multidrug transport system ATPase subunit